MTGKKKVNYKSRPQLPAVVDEPKLRRPKRTFTEAQKRRIVRDYHNCKEDRAAISALLAREGLWQSQLSEWSRLFPYDPDSDSDIQPDNHARSGPDAFGPDPTESAPTPAHQRHFVKQPVSSSISPSHSIQEHVAVLEAKLAMKDMQIRHLRDVWTFVRTAAGGLSKSHYDAVLTSADEAFGFKPEKRD